MLRERLCNYCNLYFSYDDEQDEKVDQLEQIKWGFCPRCDDPHRLSGMYFEKEELFELFVKYLKEQGVQTNVLDRDTILNMLREFPRCHALYHSNSTYRTVNLLPGTTFMGHGGDFELGHPTKSCDQPNGSYSIKREVKCLRCNKITLLAKTEYIEYYLGMKEKRCFNCDKWERNTKGLWKGYQGNEFQTDKFMARALNVSRVDYRRNRPNKPVPHLPVGTVVNVFEIVSAYWDENPNVHAPRYLVRCVKCSEQFRIPQNSIQNSVHFCKAEGKVI